MLSNSFATPWTVACQVLLSMELHKQEYWYGLQFPSIGGLPDPGFELAFPVLAAFLVALYYQATREAL